MLTPSTTRDNDAETEFQRLIQTNAVDAMTDPDLCVTMLQDNDFFEIELLDRELWCNCDD